jgi:hypothetical protein
MPLPAQNFRSPGQLRARGSIGYYPSFDPGADDIQKILLATVSETGQLPLQLFLLPLQLPGPTPLPSPDTLTWTAAGAGDAPSVVAEDVDE